jgi:hypothetical protein
MRAVNDPADPVGLSRLLINHVGTTRRPAHLPGTPCHAPGVRHLALGNIDLGPNLGVDPPTTSRYCTQVGERRHSDVDPGPLPRPGPA